MTRKITGVCFFLKSTVMDLSLKTHICKGRHPRGEAGIHLLFYKLDSRLRGNDAGVLRFRFMVHAWARGSTCGGAVYMLCFLGYIKFELPAHAHMSRIGGRGDVSFRAQCTFLCMPPRQISLHECNNGKSRA